MGGGVLAYLCATDSVTNILSIINPKPVAVVEPNWDPDKAVDLVPTQVVEKDPQLKNNTDKELYVFLDVEIPVRDIKLTGSEGSSPTEIFSFDQIDTWIQKDKITSEDNTTVTYRYIYPEPLSPNTTTEIIFDSVTVCDYINNQFSPDDLIHQIKITGHGVETEPFDTVEAAYCDYFGVEPKEELPEVDLRLILLVDSASLTTDYIVDPADIISSGNIRGYIDPGYKLADWSIGLVDIDTGEVLASRDTLNPNRLDWSYKLFKIVDWDLLLNHRLGVYTILGQDLDPETDFLLAEPVFDPDGVTYISDYIRVDYVRYNGIIGDIVVRFESRYNWTDLPGPEDPLDPVF